ncbi:MAG: (d)CMP kinase [Planctomycetales bacterium]|nr:(d)CMP kinase [Planctomycetales bacterium]
MIVTIDGPAGAGKSSVARALAERLGYRFLDTGAMYRAVALALLNHGWDELPHDEAARRAEGLTLEFSEHKVELEGRDVTGEIRSLRVTNATRLAADNPGIRGQLVELQRRLAEELGNVVTEGRDQGTVAFPDAECKIFLTATPEERARRRQLELAANGVEMPRDQLLEQIQQRDAQDEQRAVGRLMQAEDAVRICTDGMSFDQVVERLEQVVREAARHAD